MCIVIYRYASITTYQTLKTSLQLEEQNLFYMFTNGFINTHEI